MKFKPTEEQQEIVESFKDNKKIIIQALAGAAKTSTLELITKEYENLSFLYLAFNKSMANDASERFGVNTTCKTTHSLAYKSIGYKYRNKLKRDTSKKGVNLGFTTSEIVKLLRLKDYVYNDSVLPKDSLAIVIKNILSSFEQSSDIHISKKHIIGEVFNEICSLVNNDNIISKLKKYLLVKANILWNKRINIKSDVLCTHDTYLKLYQLSSPDLSEYDAILLDESQDSNLCTLDIILRQECGVILVGDRYQGIYRFRGSVDATEHVEGFKELYLTKSFRFGNEVASIANEILQNKVIMKGFEIKKSIVSFDDSIIDYRKPVTKIFRSNLGILEELLRSDHSKKVALNIDIKDTLSLLTSASSLMSGNLKNVKHSSLVVFNSFGELVKEASNNKEYSVLLSILRKKGMLSFLINILKSYLDSNNTTDEYDILLTTAHKSKGLEWDQVILGKDFESIYDENGDVIINTQERNLLYVSATRAKKFLVVNDVVREYIDLNRKEKIANG